MREYTKRFKKIFLLLMVVVQVGLYIVPYQSVTAATPRQMERLGRGVVAVKVSNGVFVSWRMLGTDPDSIAFNVYRNGTKLNSSPLTTGTNYLDAGGSTGASYTVRPVLDGQEQVASEATTALGQNYLTVPITPPGSSYTVNDCSCGDLDGDGEYEIVIKWEGATQDNANAGVTDPVYLQAYKLNGTRLWSINLGKNIRGGAHYTQFMVYDLDGCGKAEVACKTADGTTDGKGKVIGNASANYVNSGGYILTGPEYLTVFNGQTGAAISTVDYLPARGTVSSWGDDYGNRIDRFRACVAYLDGQHPSLVMGRGYYTRLVYVAWDFKDGKLTRRWTFDSNDSGNSAYAGQGNHNNSVGDVDGDGFDEIISGTSVIDHNGKGLWVTGLGHGDAMHFGDLDPNRPGLEIWSALEGSKGAVLLDARTGAQIFKYTYSKDCGRACAADISAATPGEEMWASGSPLYSCKGENVGTNPGYTNFSIWWDGDELRELLDDITISKVGKGTVLTASGCASNNGTKSTPCLQADLLGDWREEVVWRASDNKSLRIYTTTDITTRRIYTLMHDPIYRMGIAWQNTAYNQPPHTGFFLGSGMSKPPVPQMYYAGPDITPSNTPTNIPTNTPTNTTTKTPTSTPTNTTVSFREDINGDMVVNMTDVILLAAHFNTVSTDSNYDKKCDLNNDGAINMTDVIILAAKFNTIYVPSPTPAGPVIYQAEDAKISLGIPESLNTGFTGSGYVNYDNVSGSYVEWNVNVPSAGTYSLTFRYSNGTTVNRAMEIIANNNKVFGILDFNSTNDWTTWNTSVIKVGLNAGNNVIRATAITENGGPNVDYLEVK